MGNGLFSQHGFTLHRLFTLKSYKTCYKQMVYILLLSPNELLPVMIGTVHTCQVPTSMVLWYYPQLLDHSYKATLFCKIQGCACLCIALNGIYSGKIWRCFNLVDWIIRLFDWSKIYAIALCTNVSDWWN